VIQHIYFNIFFDSMNNLLLTIKEYSPHHTKK